MFSRRAEWNTPLNRITALREERRRRGEEILDLTVSNPTSAGLSYPLDELAEALQRAARAPYDPQPLGLRTARETLAQHLQCDPDDVMITASTSEAYAFLFKLLTDSGDDIAAGIPSYPLLEHLAGMEHLSLRPFRLELHKRWEVTGAEPGERTRAIAVVSPNNPTGSFVETAEMHRLAEHRLPLIIDEVFRDYPVDGGHPGQPPHDLLSFSLGGLSKSAGLPHYKLGWIRLGGPAAGRRAALEALELIADNYLSVATPVQAALPDLLRIGERIRASILERVRSNLVLVRATLQEEPSVTVLPVEGGWSVVLRIPATVPDEDIALALLHRGALVQPGYLFDFPAEGYLVISLLTPPKTLTEGLRRLLEVIPR